MNRKIFIPFIIGLFYSCFMLAQQGALAGTVVDEAGEPLISATVQILETGSGEITDFDGKYQMQLDPGTYSIVYSYVGYQDLKITDVEIKANETTVQDAVLTDGAIDMQEVVVTAKAVDRSINAVFLQRKKADQVQEVISLQEMQQLGASDAAGALSKVTGTTIVDGQYVYVRGLGDRYSYTSLNGIRLPSLDPYRNSAQLDLVPTNLLDNIVARKTFTPDLPGDFTGGSVDINSKALPERFTFNVSMSASYNDQSTMIDDFLTFDAGNSAWLGFNDGTLDFPEELKDPDIRTQEILSQTGAILGSRDPKIAELVDRAGKSLSSQFTPTEKSVGPEFGLSLGIGNQFALGESKLGVLATVNYSRSYSFYDDGIRANYVNQGSGSGRLLENFNLQDTRAVENPKLGGMFGLSFQPSKQHTISFMTLYSHSTDIEARRLEGTYFDYDIIAPEVFQSRSLGFQERELVDLILSGDHGFGEAGIRLEWAVNRIISNQEEPDLRFFANNYDPERDKYNVALSNYSGPGHFFRTLDDEQMQYKLDLTIPILQTKDKGNKVKIGGYYSTKDRDFDEDIFNRVRRQGERFDGDDEAFFGNANSGAIGMEGGRTQFGLIVTDETRPRNSYVGESNVAAAYGMFTYQFTPNFKFIGGARMETTDIFVESDAHALDPTDSLFTDINEVDLLPSANLIFALTEKTNLRASYSNTLARPNMREVAPFGSFGFIGDPPLFGNQDLVRTRINNYDLRYEIFPQPGEVAAASIFYKSFKDPIVQTFRPAGNPQFTWVNSNTANLYGAELEWRKGLGFLNEKLNNLTISGNLAYIISSVDIDEEELAIIQSIDPGADDTRPFNGQSGFIFNTNLTYANLDNGWEAVLAYNYFGDRLSQTGVEGTPDIYEKGRSKLDLSLSKKIDRVRLRLRAKNLLDPNYEYFAEFLGEEYIYTNYQRGREVSFSISYSI